MPSEAARAEATARAPGQDTRDAPPWPAGRGSRGRWRWCETSATRAAPQPVLPASWAPLRERKFFTSDVAFGFYL